MKIKIIFFLLFLLSSVHSANADVLKRTQSFIEIEVDKKNIWVACTDVIKSGNSYLGFHVLDAGKDYLFFYRKPLTIKSCRLAEKEYWSIVNETGKVKIIGISPNDNAGPSQKHKRIPQKFSQATNQISAVFIRLHSSNKCKAYFEHHCELPKNYWGGVIPQ